MRERIEILNIDATFRRSPQRTIFRQDQFLSAADGSPCFRSRCAQLGSSPAFPPYQNRIKTPSVAALWVVRRAKSRFPKLLERQRKPEKEWITWKGISRAQGRCATRLRYAPTFYLFDSKSLPRAMQRPVTSTVPKPSQNPISPNPALLTTTSRRPNASSATCTAA